MSENPFEGPYDGTFHFLQETGIGPGYTIGGINDLQRAGDSGRLRAVMLTKARPSDAWIPAQRRPITLQEIMDILPPNMLFGSIAWMVLEDETEPTTAIIYSGLDTRGLRTLTYARLFTSLRSGEKAIKFLEKSRETADLDREILKDPTPIAPFLKGNETGE